MVKKKHLILSIIFIILFAVWYVLGCEFYAGDDGGSAFIITFLVLPDEDLTPVLSEQIYAVIIGLMTIAGFVWTIVRFCRKSEKNAKAYAVYMTAWLLAFIGKFFIYFCIGDVGFDVMFSDFYYYCGELCYYPALVILGYCTYSALRQAFFKDRKKV